MNRIIIYKGIAGLHCECGNSESLSEGKNNYSSFYYTWKTITGRGLAMGSCKKCHSQLHEPQVRTPTASQSDELLATYGPAPEV